MERNIKLERRIFKDIKHDFTRMVKDNIDAYDEYFKSNPDALIPIILSAFLQNTHEFIEQSTEDQPDERQAAFNLVKTMFENAEKYGQNYDLWEMGDQLVRDK